MLLYKKLLLMTFGTTLVVEIFHILRLFLIFRDLYFGWLHQDSHYHSTFHIHFHSITSSSFNQSISRAL